MKVKRSRLRVDRTDLSTACRVPRFFYTRQPFTLSFPPLMHNATALFLSLCFFVFSSDASQQSGTNELDGNRVWDLVTGAQRYQFSSPEDRPTCVAYAPPGARIARAAFDEKGDREDGEAFLLDGDRVVRSTSEFKADLGWGDEDRNGVSSGERHLVAGYASGTIRVFDVPTACTLFECQQHQDTVHQVRLRPSLSSG